MSEYKEGRGDYYRAEGLREERRAAFKKVADYFGDGPLIVEDGIITRPEPAEAGAMEHWHYCDYDSPHHLAAKAGAVEALDVKQLERAVAEADDLYAEPRVRGAVNEHLRPRRVNPQGRRLARHIAAECARLSCGDSTPEPTDD